MSSSPLGLPPPGTFSSYQQVYGSHVYIGDRSIDLQQQLQTLSTAPSGCPQYLHVFCDILQLPGNSDEFSLTIPVGLRSIEIFARCFLSSSSEQDLVNPCVLDIKTAASVVTIMIYSDMLPAAVKLQCSSTPGLTVVTNLSHACLPDTYPILTPDQNTFVPMSDGLGVLFKTDVNGYVAGSMRDVQDISPGQLDLSVADLVDIDDVQRPNYLGHLLETIFADAAGKITDLSMTRTVRSQFTYVAKCSRNTPSWSEFYLQARTMQQRLQVPDGSLWVAAIDFKNLEFVLDYRVRLATLLHSDQQTQDIESSIEGVKELLDQAQKNILQSQQDLKAKIGQVGAEIITNMAFSNENFVRKVDDAQNELNDARNSSATLQLDFANMQADCKTAQAAFEAGIKKWKAEQKRKAEIGVVVSVFQCAIAIGSIFATDGADAEAAGPAAASAAKGIEGAGEAVKKAESTWSKIKKMFDKLKKCAEKIQAVREAIDKLNQIDPTANHAITDMKTVTDKVLPSLDATVDFTELKLNWQEFQVDMNDEFSSLESDLKDVDGYAAWKNTTQKLVLRAFAVISASKAFQDKYIALTRIQRDAARVKAHKTQLTALAAQLNNQAALDATQKIPTPDGGQLTAEQRQLRLSQLVTGAAQRAVGRWLLLDFHEYASAIMYTTSRQDFPVPLAADRSLPDLLGDIIAFKQALGSAGTLSPLAYPIQFSASEGVVSGAHWLSTIIQTNSLGFDIPSVSPVFKGHRVLRVLQVEVYVDGLVPVATATTAQMPSPSIQIAVGLGPESWVFDGVGMQRFWVEMGAPLTFDRVTGADGSELADSNVPPRGVNQKAVFSPGGQAFAPSLFGRGFVRVLNAGDWKWDGVEEVRFCFYCEADQLE
ncbi:hypothetical protein QBC47DRAFT_415496 [Echria macrotheca]|uniref:Uncharacterized protein n=1 Tax=Echria macrotheca TaxID=438768 RepID=A0AAJ0B8Q0_9PEZI|nr:hypothetical protein QBC47DRAFT_415496 [Echria macrotheca]